MKYAKLLCGVLVVVLVLGSTGFAGRQGRSKRAVMIGDLDRESGDLYVIGAHVAGKGWLTSEKAVGLMHRGEELTVYRLTEGRIGTAKLTNDGALNSDFSQGLWYKSQSSVGDGLAIVVWHSLGSAPPKWFTVEELSSGNTVYRQIICDWLRKKGVTSKIIEAVVVEQIVRADLNRDERDEVFLSFRTPNTPGLGWIPKATKDTFSYLLMRYLPRGSRQARTATIEDFPNVVHKVTALCDLDGEGWAEVATHASGVDVWGSDLHHWTGKRFRRVGRWGGGC